VSRRGYPVVMPLRVGLNGAGRIGRALLRMAHRDPQVVVAPVNDMAGAPAIAHLMRHDSVHGPFPAPVEARPGEADGGALLDIGGASLPFYAEASPGDVPWDRHGVDVVVEATGRFKEAGLARAHLRPGVRRVIVTAVSPDADATVVLGPHDGHVADDVKVVSTASCTTHAAALPLWLLDRWYGIEAAEMTTVHCTTGSQMTMDGPHADPRRARSALLSMIPTTTSAREGLELALPPLAGRLSCLAIRVPTATVSLIEIVASTRGEVDPLPGLSRRFREAATDPACAGRMGVTDEPLVSIDFNGDRRSSVVDLPLLERPGNRLVRVVAWYDNEYGYTGRLVELLRTWSGGAATGAPLVEDRT
jgi:glyceraldehyde 3-phosphate dehydrogenase